MVMSKKKKFEEKKKKAAIYCRVSTFEQGQGEVSSLNGQEDIAKKKIGKSMGFILIRPLVRVCSEMK